MQTSRRKKIRTGTTEYSFENKVLKFLAAVFLADIIIGNSILFFIQNLYNRGVFALVLNFNVQLMIWGNSLLWNVIHVLILFFISGLFGFLFGYLSRKVSFDEKILFSTFYLILHFILINFFAMAFDFLFYPGYWADLNQVVNQILFKVEASKLVVIYILLGLAGMISTSVYFINIGSKVIKKANISMDKTNSGTLFDIKWYHFSWLWFSIIFYSQVILNFLYQSVNAFIIMGTKTKGPSISEGTKNVIKDSTRNFSWGNFFWITVISGIGIFLLAYLQKILSGKIKKELSVQIIFAIGIGFVIPMIIFFFTPFAG